MTPYYTKTLDGIFHVMISVDAHQSISIGHGATLSDARLDATSVLKILTAQVNSKKLNHR